MKTVFNRTLTSMFKPISIIIYFVLVTGSITLISLVSAYSGDPNTSIEIQKISVVETFALLNFIWISGILLNIFIMAFGSGIFAAEESEGTMRILLAKPNSRGSVIFGKIFGLFIGSFMYMLSSLIISITIFSLITSIDSDVLKSLLNKLPLFIAYGLFIIFFFVGITAALSSLFKKRIPAIIILIIFILFTYGILPIARTIAIAFGKYDKYHLYLVDTNYHVGSVYLNILELNGELNLSPMGQETIGIFTGAYVFKDQDKDKINAQTDYYFLPREKNDVLDRNIVLIIYSTLSVGAYIFCYIRMKNKDIT